MENSLSMPNRTKPAAEKQTKPIVVNVTPPLKADVDAMAVATGVDTSKRVRDFLQAEVEKWKRSQEED